MRRDLGGDHAPWDRLAAWQLSAPQRGADDDAGGEVQAELQLGGAGLGRGRGQDAEVRGEVLPASVTTLNVSSFSPAC